MRPKAYKYSKPRVRLHVTLFHWRLFNPKSHETTPETTRLKASLLKAEEARGLTCLIDYAGRMQAIFGGPMWSGKSTTSSLRHFANFGHTQGVCHRLLDVGEQFAKKRAGQLQSLTLAAFWERAAMPTIVSIQGISQ